MRRVSLLACLLVIALVAVSAAQAYTGCCTGVMSPPYPAGTVMVFGSLDANGCVAAWQDAWSPDPCPQVTPVPPATPTVVPTPIPTVAPTPPPPPPPPEGGGLWDLIKAWADRFVIWHGDAASVGRILAVLATFMGVVQGLKKILESATKWEWLVNLIPQLSVVLNFLAHGIGPIIINALVTGGTLLTAAVADGSLTAGELLAIVGAVVGTDVLYRLVRGLLFPHSTTA